jgi:hypothetical protein
MLARKVRRRATRKGRVAVHCSRRTVRMRVATRGGDVVRPYIKKEGSLGWRSIAEMGVWWRRWEGVHGLTVARWFVLRIATALSDMGVGSSNYISNVDRLRVHACVYERHLLQNQRERVGGRNKRALLRARVRGIKRRNKWRVGGTSFRCHRGKGKNQRDDRQR